jgi:flagellar basal-body rod modification protein FlgD
MNPTGFTAALGQDQFLQLLVAQLRNQDPLSPVDNSQFISQLSGLSQLQGIQNLNTSFGEMLKLQQLTQGTNLIGKQVEFSTTVNGAATNKTGTVDSVATQNDKFVLKIGSDTVGLDQVVTVKSS